MKAYRKTSTSDPFCVYFSRGDARRVLCELAATDKDTQPELHKLFTKLHAVSLGTAKRA